MFHLLIAFALAQTHAAPIHEVWVHQGPLTARVLERWSAEPSGVSRELLLNWESPSSSDLDAVLSVRGMTRIRIETPRAPRTEKERWKAIAARGVEWIGILGDTPTDSEIQSLNEIRFAKNTFVLTQFPQPSDSARLARIQTPLALSFNSGKLPTFSTKPGFDPLPASTPMLFVADYWPFYSHMDFFNLLTQPIRLRIRDSFPYGIAIEYLANIQRLEEIAVQVDFSPSRAQWESLPQSAPIAWIPRGSVPSEQSIRTLESVRSNAAPTRIVIDSDLALSAMERARLERSSLAIEWIRSAPR
jgi:hypothetical protein